MGLEPLFHAWSYFRRRKFRECADVCSQLLERPPGEQELDSEYTVFQAAWSLKTRALTEMVYVDEIDIDQEGIAEMILDENAIAQVARPGTSLKLPGTSQGGGPSPAVRPVTQSGRPITGFVRPSTQSGRPSTMEQAIRTPRTALTARPITSASGGYVRPGTASMLTNPDGPFINLSRLNLTKYAQKPKLAKALFEYIFHHENDIKNALDLAALATEYAQFKDWWWKVQIGKCYYRLGLYREAEKQFKSALKQQDMVDTILYLAKVYLRLDQPVTALNLFKQGLERFPGEVTLICGIARIYEEMNNISSAAEYYKEVLKQDNTHVEAIACIGSNHFYSDQPEIALRFYRRLLQMGVYNCQLFNNLGLCCFYAQQYDMTLSSFERALFLAENEEETADVWYNLGHVAVGIGDLNLAYQCFKLTLVNNNDYAEAYNNLAVGIRSALNDATQAKKLKPTHLKAIIRGALCHMELKNFVEAVAWCEEGLQIDSKDKKLVEMRAKADKLKRIQERDARKAKVMERKEQGQKEILLAAIKERNIKLVVEPSDEEEEVSDGLAEMSLDGFHSGSATGAKVHLDADGSLSWPVLFLYPEHEQTDFTVAFHESSRFIDHLMVMFAELPPWDLEKKYLPNNLELYFEDEEREEMYEVNPEHTLLQVLQHERYFVKAGTPTVLVFAKRSPFSKKYFSGKKVHRL